MRITNKHIKSRKFRIMRFTRLVTLLYGIFLLGCTSTLLVLTDMDGKWSEAGFTYKEAKEWNNVLEFIPEFKNYDGTMNQKDRIRIAEKLREYGFSPEEANLWFQNGFKNIDEIVKLKTIGVNIEEAKRLKGMGFLESLNFFSIEEITQLKSLGLSIEDIDKLIKNNFRNPELVAKWKTRGFSIDEMIRWGPKVEPEDIKEWKKLGFTPKKAREWSIEGLTPGEIVKWQKKGFKLDTIIKWYSNFRRWYDNLSELLGHSIEEDIKEVNKAILEEAISWRDKGFSYEEAKKWKNCGCALLCGGCSPNVALRLKKECGEVYPPPKTLYETQGECYEFSGSALQWIDEKETSGLFVVGYPAAFRLLYIDSLTDPHGATIYGIIKGMGDSFSYIAVSGAVTVVPHFRAIFICHRND